MSAIRPTPVELHLGIRSDAAIEAAQGSDSHPAVLHILPPRDDSLVLVASPAEEAVLGAREHQAREGHQLGCGDLISPVVQHFVVRLHWPLRGFRVDLRRAHQLAHLSIRGILGRAPDPIRRPERAPGPVIDHGAIRVLVAAISALLPHHYLRTIVPCQRLHTTIIREPPRGIGIVQVPLHLRPRGHNGRPVLEDLPRGRRPQLVLRPDAHAGHLQAGAGGGHLHVDRGGGDRDPNHAEEAVDGDPPVLRVHGARGPPEPAVDGSGEGAALSPDPLGVEPFLPELVRVPPRAAGDILLHGQGPVAVVVEGEGPAGLLVGGATPLVIGHRAIFPRRDDAAPCGVFPHAKRCGKRHCG
mmetsp:Transcript_24863/g.63439  ORF Transcript_24863/g.63439 Transcript_24863/m.63439 type:complete len:356 (-) Transcript_24863:366-1433(-)